MNLLSDSTDTVRQHRGMIIFWLVFSLILSSLGQIIAGPQGFYLALALIAVLIFIFYSRKNFLKTVIGFLLIFILVLGFVVVKNVNASPNKTSESETTKANLDQPETVSNEVEGSAQEPIEEECHTLDNFEDGIKQWCNLVVKYADQYSLDPILIASIIQKEGTHGNPEILSPQSAVGLMQIMPRDTGWSYFSDRPTTEELKNPETNIDWGCEILVGKIAVGGGDLREGLRLYGPTDYGYLYADAVINIYEEKSK